MLRSIKKYFVKVLNRIEKLYNLIVCSLIISLSSITPAYATTPKLVSGTVALFQAVTGWLLLIIPVGAGAVLGFHALQKSLSDDAAVIAEKNKHMKNVVIGAAIAETASGLVTILLGFYK